MSVAPDEDFGLHLGHIGPWTLEQVLALPEDRQQRVELVDGALVMSPHAGTLHQRIMYKLRDALERAAEAADADVEVFTDINVVMPCGLLVPDVVVVDAAAVEDTPLTVPADAISLVVEIISPYNRNADMVLKRKLYAEAAIPCYWRVDPRPSPRILIDEFDGQGYVAQPTLEAGVTACVTHPFAVELDPGNLVVR